MNSDFAPNTPNSDWPDELDALIAAPENHQLLLENERTKVLDTRIPPGGRTPVHTHRWPAVLYVLSWSDFVRYDSDGKVLLDSRTIESFKVPPTTVWSAPLPPHSLENVGSSELHVISVELKERSS